MERRVELLAERLTERFPLVEMRVEWLLATAFSFVAVVPHLNARSEDLVEQE